MKNATDFRTTAEEGLDRLKCSSKPKAYFVAGVLLAGISTYGQHASAQLECSKHWHTIKASAQNAILKTEPPNGAAGRAGWYVDAVGKAGVEPWYEWVLFCRDLERWANTRYVIYSNTTANYWEVEGSGDGVKADYPTIPDNPQSALFEILPYAAGSKFWTIKAVGLSENLFTDSFHYLRTRSWLGGDDLFEMDSSDLMY